MIVVKVELHSAINGTVKELGRMIITNTGGNLQRGNYVAKVGRKKASGDPVSLRSVYHKPQRTGTVDDYPRLSYSVWRLVSRAILSCYPEEAKAKK